MKTLGRERDRAEILGRLKAVRPDSVRRWGRMSAHGMVCHLADAYRMALGSKAVSPAHGPLQRTIVKWFALYAPLPWPAGRIRTCPEIDQEGGGSRPVDFASDIAQVETLLGLITAARSLGRQAHPTFGPMSDAAWLRWAYLHADHHLRQFGA
jgi:hypothetical protein